MGLYQWHRDQWSNTGCKGSFKDPGWYTKSGKLLAKTFRDPKTGNRYTNAALAKLASSVKLIKPVKPVKPCKPCK